MEALLLYCQKAIQEKGPPQCFVKSKEEPVDQTFQRGDAIAWILAELAKLFEGMYMTSYDHEFVDKLCTTVGDLSRRGEYSKASAKLQAAIERLVTMLEHSNPTQVDMLRLKPFSTKRTRWRNEAPFGRNRRFCCAVIEIHSKMCSSWGLLS